MRQHFLVQLVGTSFQHCFLTSSMEKGKIDYRMNFVFLSLVVRYVLPHYYKIIIIIIQISILRVDDSVPSW